MRKSFILHLDSLEILDELEPEQQGQLLVAMRDYTMGKEVKLTGLMKAIFIPFKNQFDRDNEKYESTIERNKINGAKGGRKKETQNNPTKPTGFSENPNKADNKNESKNKNDNVSDSKGEQQIIFESPYANVERFVAPELEEVKMYFSQQGRKSETAERFFNHYSGLNWMKGNSRIFNWRSFALNWEDLPANKSEPPKVEVNNGLPGHIKPIEQLIAEKKAKYG